MADPKQEITRLLKMEFQVDAAEAQRQAAATVKLLDRLGYTAKNATGESKMLASSLSYMGKSATDANKVMGTLGGSVGFLAGSMTKLSSAAELVSLALGGAAVVHAIRDTRDYYKTLLSTTQQFKAYGASIKDVQGLMKSLHNEYGFTNTQALQLAKTMDKSFSYMPLRDMTTYAKFLSDAVGDDVEEMQNLANAIGSASTKMVGLQQMMKRTERGGFLPKDAGAIQGNAISLALAGKISPNEMKEMLSLSRAGSRRSGVGVSEEGKAKSFINDANRPEQFVNDASIALGQKFTPELSTAAGLLKKYGEEVTKVTSTLGKLTAYLGTGLVLAQSFVAAGGILGYLNGLTRRTGGMGGGGGIASAVGGALTGAVGGRPIPVYVVNLPGLPGMGGRGDVTEQFQSMFPPGLGQKAGLRGGLNNFFSPAAGGIGGFIGRGGAFGKLGGAASGALGGALGGLAGWGAEEGLAHLTGNRAENGGFTSSIGGMGASLGVGLLAGGPLGAIVALVTNISNNLQKCFEVWQDIRKINEDIAKADADFKNKNQTLTDKLKAEKAPKALLDVRATSALLQEKRDQLENSSHWYNKSSTYQKAKEEFDQAQAAHNAAVMANAQAKEDAKSGALTEGGAAYRERWAKQNEEMEKAKKTATAKLEIETAELDKTVEMVSLQQTLSMMLENQQQTLAKSNTYFQAQLEMTTALANGPSRELMDAFGDYVSNIDSSNKLLQTQLSLVSHIVEEARASGAAIGGSSADIAESVKKISTAFASKDREKINQAIADESKSASGLAALMQFQKQLGATLLEQEVQRGRAANELLRVYDMELSIKQAVIDQGEVELQIADNLAMGVAASANMRMAQSQKLAAYEEVLGQKRTQAEKNIMFYINEQNKLKKEGGSKEAMDSAIAGEKQQRLELLKITTDMLRTEQKRLELTKLLRDGWLGAINAMTNGVGMFEKIVLSKDKRLGTVMAYEPKKVVGIQTGFAGKGRTESTSFSAQGVGVLTNPEKAGEAFGGGSKEWNRAMDKRSPLGFLGSQGFDINNPEFLSKLQESLKNSKLSMDLAGATSTPFGMSELIEAGKKAESGMRRAADGVQRSTIPASALPNISPVSGDKGSSIDNKQMDKFKSEVLESMTKAFRGICDAAMTRVMDDLQKGR